MLRFLSANSRINCSVERESEGERRKWRVGEEQREWGRESEGKRGDRGERVSGERRRGERGREENRGWRRSRYLIKRVSGVIILYLQGTLIIMGFK